MRPAAASIRIVRDRSLHRTALPGAHCAGVRSLHRAADAMVGLPQPPLTCPRGRISVPRQSRRWLKTIVLSLLGLVAGKAGGFGIRTHHPIAGVSTSESLEAPATHRRITLQVLVHHAQHLACTHGDRVVRAHRRNARRWHSTVTYSKTYGRRERDRDGENSWLRVPGDCGQCWPARSPAAASLDRHPVMRSVRPPAGVPWSRRSACVVNGRLGHFRAASRSSALRSP